MHSWPTSRGNLTVKSEERLRHHTGDHTYFILSNRAISADNPRRLSFTIENRRVVYESKRKRGSLSLRSSKKKLRSASDDFHFRNRNAQKSSRVPSPSVSEKPHGGARISRFCTRKTTKIIDYRFCRRKTSSGRSSGGLSCSREHVNRRCSSCNTKRYSRRRGSHARARTHTSRALCTCENNDRAAWSVSVTNSEISVHAVEQYADMRIRVCTCLRERAFARLPARVKSRDSEYSKENANTAGSLAEGIASIHARDCVSARECV